MGTSPIDFTPMADGHHKHHEPAVLDRCDDAKIADAVAPEPFAIAGQRMREATSKVGSVPTVWHLASIGLHPPLVSWQQ